jgi:hypothetical protein
MPPDPWNRRVEIADANVILRQLQFEKSPPFTDLIRELIYLSQSFTIEGVCWNTGRQPWLHGNAIANSLGDCQTVARSVKKAMEGSSWADECDKAEARNYFSREQAVKVHALVRASPPSLHSTDANGAPK